MSVVNARIRSYVQFVYKDFSVERARGAHATKTITLHSVLRQIVTYFM